MPQTANVFDLSESGPNNEDICLGRIRVRQLVHYNGLLSSDYYKRKDSHQDAKASITNQKTHFAVCATMHHLETVAHAQGCNECRKVLFIFPRQYANVMILYSL